MKLSFKISAVFSVLVNGCSQRDRAQHKVVLIVTQKI